MPTPPPAGACACGPSALQYFLGALTFVIGLYGTWLLYRSARLNAEAAGLFENYPIAASDAFRSVVHARIAARRRKLTELSGDHSVAGAAVLFFALVAGLTINFPRLYAAAIAASLLSGAALAVLSRREPDIDHRLELFVRSQEVIAAAHGHVFVALGDSTLDYVLRVKRETLAKDEVNLKELEQRFDAELRSLREQVKAFEDEVSAHRST